MKDPSTYDVAIIGGGLAGLCLSIQLADAGHSVVLFEKEVYPFHKVCGEYISLESWDFLERLGVPLSSWILPVIKKFQVSDVKGQLYNFNLPLGGFGISRYKLDAALYQLALAKRVQVFTGTKVTDTRFADKSFVIDSAAGNFTATAVAGSFGKRSNLDLKWNRLFTQQKASKLNNYMGIKYHIRYPHPPDTIALHNFHNGYCGISKIEDDRYCLCYLTTAQNLKQSGYSIAQMEASLLQQNPRLKEIFSNAEFLYQEPLAISQISFDKKMQVEDHVLMIGDAAGMITPLCGNGMSMAMHGSKIAFEQIHLFLQQQISRTQMEAAYTNQWKKQFSKRLWMGRNVQRTFGGNTSSSLFFKTMKAIPPLARLVIRSTHGEPF
ncbi:MAG: NAD(P)/FAD-dependent oxidoreductase [Chitinophagaceae bacterium]